MDTNFPGPSVPQDRNGTGVGHIDNDQVSSSTNSSSFSLGNTTNNRIAASNNPLPNNIQRAEPTPATSPSSSSQLDENEDEHCVYTYKGGSNRSLADLPASFFEFDSSLEWNSSNNGVGSSNISTGSSAGPSTNNPSTSSSVSNGPAPIANGLGLHMPRPSPENGPHQASIYSPDMDFLEMDFDPGIPGDDDDVVGVAVAPDCEISSRNQIFSCDNLLTVSRHRSDEILDTTDGSPPQHRLPPSPKPGPSKRVHASMSLVAPSSANANEVLPHCNSNSLMGQHSSDLHLENSQSIAVPIPSGLQSSGVSSSSGSCRLITSSSRAPPQLNLSMRLVKSNTLPKMGSGSCSNPTLAFFCVGGSSSTTAASTPSSSSSAKSVGATVHQGNFTPTLRTTGLSYSVPLMDSEHQKLQEHYKAVLLTKMPNQEPINFDIGEIMIWTVEEACAKSLSQIGVSACGATAVLNVLTALGCNNISTDYVKAAVGTRLRAEHAELPEYLFSRSHAGATHEDLIRAIHTVTSETICAKFFRPHPGISKDAFSKWLLSWICKGAVPIVTRNLQVPPSPPYENPDVIPDSWHHQMVFGLSPRGVYLNNPIECTPVESLLSQLTSDSTLLIRREDVTIRMLPRTDLRKLARHPDPRWNELNVLGQVANMFLEQGPVFNETSIAKRTRTSHITIPAAYKGGVILSVLKSSPYYQLLLDSPEQIPFILPEPNI